MMERSNPIDNPDKSHKTDENGSGNGNDARDIADNDQMTSRLNNQHSFSTPNILLEQLAYMDTLMPSIGQNLIGSGLLSFSNSGAGLSSILSQNEGAGGDIGSDNNNSQINGNFEFSLDEQLALELSAFADEDFIFAEEEKPKNSPNDSKDYNDSDDNGSRNHNIDRNHNGRTERENDSVDINRQGSSSMDNSSFEHNSINKIRRNSHFLTQRKNTSLISQYDQSKSRFSSTRGHKRSKIHSQNVQGPIEPAESEFSNFENHPTQHANISSDATRSGGCISVQRFQSPSVEHKASPISSLLYSEPHSQELQYRSNNDNNHNNDSGSVNPERYSKYQLSALISAIGTVPVQVPTGARQALLNVGLSNESIDIIAAIVAYHERKQSHNENSTNTSHPEGIEQLQQESYSDPNLLKDKYLSMLLSASSSSNLTFGESFQRMSETRTGFRRQSNATATERYLNTLSNTTQYNNPTTNSVLLPQLNHYNQWTNITVPHIPSVETNAAAHSFLPTMATQFTAQQPIIPRTDGVQTSVPELMSLVSSLQERIRTLEGENRLLKEIVRSRDSDKGQS